ncbi:MAG: CvpA family protein [Alistipes sp.]|nr:CvpA family protein [Alistipes sp.]
MNWIDWIVCIVFSFAVWNGWRKGCVVQLCGLAGLLVAVWLALHFGSAVGLHLGITPEYATAGGFVIVLLVVLIAAVLLGRGMRKLLRFVGLGFLDVALGIALAVVKYALLLSVLFSAFGRLNDGLRIVDPQTLAQSKTYEPISQFAGWLFPQAASLKTFSISREQD